MTNYPKNDEINRDERSAWLLHPARTWENVIQYGIILAIAVLFTLLLF